jgi:hypothetical protein
MKRDKCRSDLVCQLVDNIKVSDVYRVANNAFRKHVYTRKFLV